MFATAPSSFRRLVLAATAACAAGRVGAAGADAAPDFDRDVRPILAENCYACHGQDASKRQADLRLDDRAAAVAARALVPGDPGASTVLERICSSDPEVVMPPPSSNRTLTAEQKATLDRWIASGAEYRPHWAFVPPQRPAPPTLRRTDWPRNEIDRFVLAGLEAAGMAPSPEADRPTLIRRLHADLVGLPPAPEEVDAFAADTDPQAYEHLVDRLLARPQYGERMALPWLDAARYADSNGFQQDGDTWQWVWRDWVVRALNDDMPFDRFSTEQLAGDLLPDATVDQRIASAFNRNHLLNGEGGAIPEEQRYNGLFDRVDTTSTTWLGLTMACAQCHDHKYDPIAQADYYRMLDLFNRVPESGVPSDRIKRFQLAAPLLEIPQPASAERIAVLEGEIRAAEEEQKPVIEAAWTAWKAALGADGQPIAGKAPAAELADLLGKPAAERTPEEEAALDAALRKHAFDKVRRDAVKDHPSTARLNAARKALDAFKADTVARVMVMSDAQPRETRVLDRGDYLSPRGEKLEFNPPAFLPPLPEDAPRNRLGLARWLFLAEHPLTARVQVNRMWQHFFGAGLVKTAEDLGVQSEYPLHLGLLDWLAVEFRAGDWSQKRMHRLIVTSATYRQSSRVTAEHLARDPENRLLGRAGRFRLPSPVLRDTALTAAGLLDPRLGGQPVYPYQPDAIWESLAITKERDFTYPASHGTDLYRRSLYTFWRRTVSPANMFDAANRQTCTVRAGRTCTPLHALTMLNDPTWVEAARALAERAMRSAADTAGRLSFAFRRVLGRVPGSADLAALERTFQRQLDLYRADTQAAAALLAVGESPRDAGLDAAEHAALAATCLAILNLDEAQTRE